MKKYIDKKKSVKITLGGVAQPSLRSKLRVEAIELTAIGNNHLIQHSEVNQVMMIDVDHVDYLFVMI